MSGQCRCAIPIIERVQRFVRIVNIYEAVEEVSITFRLPLSHTADMACFERHVDAGNDKVGTYLTQPNSE
ncbi:hypothetical protein [Vulcanisaeta distributa]|uniref:hypothetical protein n=1 Tax=Vulcanisaeta distributa TaxID=164451 RepID=UPI000A506CB4|nr:hypothetical protein [Vulcanisaeta distributa]